MKFLSILVLAGLITACGGSKMSETEKKEMLIKTCLKSAGVDANNPNSTVSPSQIVIELLDDATGFTVNVVSTMLSHPFTV